MAQRVNIEVLNKAAVDVTVQNSNAINVEVPTAPRGLSAEFTANKTEIDQFETVDFSATNPGFQYFFSIEDVDGFIFKSGKDVSHEYRDIGEFDVALTQADLNQQVSGIQVKRDLIKVVEPDTLLDKPFAIGATAAYSLRKLKSSATQAVRVREDAGNTETDIRFSGALLDTTALLNHCGSANGFVTKWYDQSGNGNDASQSTASGQPQIVSSGSIIKENNEPAIEFDGSDDKLSFDPQSQLRLLVGGNYHTFFTVQKATTTRSIFGIEGEYNMVVRDNGSTFFPLYGLFGANTGTQSGGDDMSNQTLLSVNWDSGTGGELFVNSTGFGLQNITDTSSNSGNNFFIGTFKSGSVGFDGTIQEIIIYESDKSNSQSQIENNISGHYAIF